MLTVNLYHDICHLVGKMHIAKVSHVSTRSGQQSVEHDFIELVSLLNEINTVHCRDLYIVRK